MSPRATTITVINTNDSGPGNQRHPRFLKEEKSLDIFLPSQVSSVLAKPGYEEAQ